ncbi:MAG: purine-nucleoside phosphorylase [Myxococcales bacterium]|nr:purine-nucleoside phosphorylase [Myxococcales bacterium]
MTIASNLRAALDESKAAIARHTPAKPVVGIILGSGLGDFADILAGPTKIPFSDIPHMPSSTVPGHHGKLVIGERHGMTVAALQGRVHMYEGHSAAQVAYPARLLVHLGARVLVLTNAAGGIRAEWPPCTLMLINDHIDMLRDQALRGPNDETLGPRFPDMTYAYHPTLRALAHTAASRAGITLQDGVYAAMPGPAYETPAEIRMLRAIGADAAGMSTVPETVVANHMGAKVIGISCITNQAAGLSPTPLTHHEVTTNAQQAKQSFGRLLDEILRDLASPGILQAL